MKFVGNFFFFVILIVCSDATATEPYSKSDSGGALIVSLTKFFAGENIAGPQHVIIGAQPNDEDLLPILWFDARQLWLAELPSDDPTSWDDHWYWTISSPRGGTVVNLNSDVVDNTGSGTYQLSTSWTANLALKLLQHGEIVTITPTKSE